MKNRNYSSCDPFLVLKYSILSLFEVEERTNSDFSIDNDLRHWIIISEDRLL